jgi:predicted permease
MNGGLRRTMQRVLALFKRRAIESELELEMSAHLDLAIDENLRAGMSPDEARRRAMISFGGVQQAKEKQYASGGIPQLDIFMQDLRYTLRTLRRDVGFAFIAVLILALGIGANIVVFSVVNTILLRPLPFQNPQQLVWIAPPNSGHDLSGATYSADAFEDFKAMNRSYEDVTAYFAFSTPDNLKMLENGELKPLTGILVAGNFFNVLGVQPEMGRSFNTQETRSGGRSVVVTHAFWQRDLGSDRSIVGKTLTLNNSPFTVIGVLPESFDFGAVFSPGEKVDMFAPQNMDDIRSEGNTLTFIGRLKPGVTLQQAQTEATTLSAKLYANKKYANSLGNYKGRVVPIYLKDYVSGSLRRSLIVLWCAVGMILLIVCVNLSNLLLARAATRTKEFALRISLGAGRGRLVRQLLTESLVLSGCGALVGLGLAYAATAWLAHQGSIALPLMSTMRVDGSALAWTLLLAVAVGLLFGIVPGLKMSGGNLQESLKDSGPGTSDGRKHERLRTVLVVSEVALACVLIVGAGLLLRSFLQVLDIDLGFKPSNAAAINVDYNFGNDLEKRSADLQNILQRVQEIPGVQAAGLSDNLPLERNRGWDGPLVKGKAYPPNYGPGAYIYIISPGFIPAMGMRVYGRDLSWSDGPKSELVMVINKKAAKDLWPDEDAVGRMTTFNGKDVRVVGVVDDLHESSVEGAAGWQVYLPMTQGDWGPEGSELVIRSGAPAAGLATKMQKTLQSINPGQAAETLRPIQNVVDQMMVLKTLQSINPGQAAVTLRPIQSIVDHATSPRRFFAILVGIFAALGLVLASLGIYGVISYSVTRKKQEIGIRMALGATRERVQMDVIVKTLQMAVVGIVLGTIASFAVAKAISTLLFATQPADPATFVGMIVLLMAVAFAAGYLPARRASRIEPMVALRND